MEYEIESETELFDDSTNPSLEHGHPEDAARRSGPRTQKDPAERRKLQKAVLIPEEEEQLA